MSAGGGGSEEDGDLELNLAPIIDCFTVLITYLLVSASYITLDLLQVSVVTTSDQPPPAQAQTDPPYSLSINVGQQGVLLLRVSGGVGNQEFNFPVAAGTGGVWDYVGLERQLDLVMRRYPTVKEVSVKADPDVQYQAIVAAIERIRVRMPKVFLGE